MKKKLILIGTFLIPIMVGIVVLVACLIMLDFFGANVTDGYVVDNMEYASNYKATLNKNIKNGNGYVSLERILYFYLENDSLTFDEIYTDNLDIETKKQKSISDVCLMDKYKNYSVCSESSISTSGQIDEEQKKPFNAPLEISNMNVTSFFMEQRIVFGKYDTHNAWDFSSPNLTNVYSVCDGIVETVSFKFDANITNTNGGGGNQIKIKCDVDDITYHVLYAHLYPGSAKVKVGDKVTHWQLLGGVGTTGYSTGPHLHYQVYKDDTVIDGVSLIDFTYLNTQGNAGQFEINQPSLGY